MGEPMHRLLRTMLLGAVTALAHAAVAPASANQFDQLFTRKMQDEICTRSEPSVVDRNELAHRIIEDLKVPRRLLGGRGDAYNYDALTREPAFTGIDEDATKYSKLLQEAHGNFAGFVAITSPSKLSAEGYAIRPPVPESMTLKRFLRDRSVVIDCLKPPQNAEAKQRPTPGRKLASSIDEGWKYVKVRKSVDDLLFAKDALADLKPALLSFREDRLTGERTMSIDGTVGVVLYHSSAPALIGAANPKGHIVGYARRYAVTHRSGLDDADLVQPGLLVDVSVKPFAGNGTAVTVRGDASYIDNRQFDSKEYKWEAAAWPTIAFGPTVQFLRGPLWVTDNVRVVPEVKFLFSGHEIEDAGTNKKLKGKESYTSGGLVATAGIGVVDIPFLSRFTLIGTYYHIDNSNGIEPIRRSEIGLNYRLPDSENWTLSFDYRKGTNPETLVAEDYWLTALGFRY